MTLLSPSTQAFLSQASPTKQPPKNRYEKKSIFLSSF